MKNLQHIFVAIISALALTFLTEACTDQFDSRDLREDYGERLVSLEFSTGEYEQVLRSALSKDAEKQIENLYVWIFNKKDGADAVPVIAKKYSADDLVKANAARKTKYGDAGSGEVPTAKGLLEQGIRLPVGDYLIYMLANVPGGGLYNVDGLGLDGDLTAIRIGKLDESMVTLANKTKDRDNGLLLMSAKETKFVGPSTTRLDVALKRVDARVDFSIGLSSAAQKKGDVFVAKEYAVYNIPTFAYLFQKRDNDAMHNPLNRDSGAHFDSRYRSLDSLDQKSKRSVATFYMPECITEPTTYIKNVFPSSASPTEKYKARAKQDKRSFGLGNVNPYLENGDFVYAPKYATYIEIKGEYRQTLEDKTLRVSDVTYRVLLGDFREDPDDYNTRRDTHYTYTITVNGVDDILTEVQSNKTTGEKEPAPDNDGFIYDTLNDFQLDSHYEQRTFLIKRSDLGLTSGSVASIGYYVSTPFQAPKIVTYSKNELSKFTSSNVKPASDKWTDNGWLRFYIHTSGTDPYSSVYYTDLQESDLLTVEQFLYQISSDNRPTGGRYGADDVFKVTVFVDENYYESVPSYEGNNPKDKDLWKRFVNTPDRKFMLLVPENNRSPYSPDGQSAQFRSVVTLSQYPIRTVFQSDAGGKVRIWGVESVDETPNLDFAYLSSSEPLSRWTVFFSNGFSNTWTLLGEKAVFKPNDEIDLTNFYGVKKPYNLNFWTLATLVTGDGVRLNPEKTQGSVMPAKNFNYAMFAPFSRNRDENHDGRMQRREMRWFIPSPAEAALFSFGQQIFPTQIQIHARGAYYPTILFTSRAYRASTNLNLNANNPFIITTGTSSNTYLYDYEKYYGVPGASPGERTPFSHTRLIRDLGILDEFSDTDPRYKADQGHYIDGDLNKELPRTVNIVFDASNYRFMRADNLNPLMLRKARATSELPMHDQTSSVNKLYEKGFEVATGYAREYGADYRDGDREDARKFYNAKVTLKQKTPSWQKLQHDINSGFSPCATYWQYSDVPGNKDYDKGTWRVPNQAEMLMMMVNLFDWHSAELGKNYNGSVKFPMTWAPSKYNLGTRTGYGHQGGTATLPFAYGYEMHVEGYLRMVGTTWDISRWVDDTEDMYVRCVRDLK